MGLSGDRFFRFSLMLAAALTLCHLVALPIVVSFDGHLYIDLADVLFSPRFPRDWDFLRTPLYPLLLKLSFWVFGLQSQAAILVGSTLGFGGLVCTASIVKNAGYPRGAGVVAVGLSLFPVLVGYEHAVLTEAGSFFFLALSLYVAVRAQLDWRGAFWVSVAVIGGYFYRPTLLYMGPVIAACLLLVEFAARPERSGLWGWLGGVGSRRAVACAVAIAVVPFLVSRTWGTDPSRVDDQWFFAMFKQALLPPGHPSLRDVEGIYLEAIDRATHDGHIDWAGLDDGTNLSVNGRIRVNAGGGGQALFLRLVAQEPRRYLVGVGRSLVVLIGFPANVSENRLFRDFPLAQTGSRVMPGPEQLAAAIHAHFDQPLSDSAVARVLRALRLPFEVLVVAGFFMTLVALGLALVTHDKHLLILSVVPIAFVMLHAAILMSIDRYGFPAYPLVLALLFLTPAKGWELFRRRRVARQLALTGDHRGTNDKSV